MMRIIDLIEKKRDGGEHSREEIEFVVNGILTGEVKDYQATAWMMAVCCRGMSAAETADLTAAMTASGETVDLSDLPGFKVDKHSTGGVGDTTTLIVAPLVAACGGTVAKMSGRGLAHSGGTLDKLESVPGVSVEQELESFKRIVRENGVCVIGQSSKLDPADKKMYALRDVSGTVPSIPLIASSIMSKKIASGADGIVLDVKTGNGAFMETLDEARTLASAMVSIGKHAGKKTVAIITDMNRPLGMAIGNGLELKEAVEALSGKLSYDDPLMRVSFALAENMLMISDIAKNEAEAEKLLRAAVVSGEGLKRLRTMIASLGGDVSYIDQPEKLVKVSNIVPVYAQKSGYVGAIDAKRIGTAALVLGAGRERVTDSIDPAVGILMHKRYGDSVEAGELLAEVYANDETNLNTSLSLLNEAVNILCEKPDGIPLVYDIIK